MDINDWLTLYNNIDKKNAKNCLDDFYHIVIKKDIIIYGAKLLGNNFKELFSILGIPILAFLDEKVKRIDKKYGGGEVFTPDYIYELSKNKDIIIILAASSQTQLLMKKNLFNFCCYDGYKIYSLLKTAFCTIKLKNNEEINTLLCESCSMQDDKCHVLRHYLMKRKGFNIDNKDYINLSGLNLISYVLGNICSLKCKDCIELITIYKNEQKHFVPYENVINDIMTIAKSSYFISCVDFFGGEPFLHPNLNDIINNILKINNVGLINIFTNGVICPNDSLCSTLSNDRIRVCISNYEDYLNDTQKNNIFITEHKLNQFNIPYFRRDNIYWLECNTFDLFNDTDDILEYRYKNCIFHNCLRVENGIIYNCPHHHAGAVTGLLPDSIKDTINIKDFNCSELALELDRYDNLKYINACKYCKLPFNCNVIPSGIQL